MPPDARAALDRMPKICFWSTSFQSDTQALACHLADQPGYEVVVAMDRPDAYRAEPVESLLPFRGKLLDRAERTTRRALEAFGADVMVVDNHLPSFRVAPRLVVVWHGFGWRVDDLGSMRKELASHVGDVTRPNPRFRWLAFGDWDKRYRVEHSRLAEDNVWSLGSPYSDLLRPESALVRSFSRAEYQRRYPVDLGRKLVTLGLTWHHGGALQHWGDDRALSDHLLGWIGELGASVLIRMHDRHRYERAHVEATEALARRHPHVALKFKSEAPDSLVDMLLTDVLVSNYSSLLNPFYHTRKPTIHVDPSDASSAESFYRVLKRGRVQAVPTRDGRAHWKLAPDQVGGLRARSFAELGEQIQRALAEPDCCAPLAADFCERYLVSADGQARARIQRRIEAWLENPVP
jgi:hypothetical protein